MPVILDRLSGVYWPGAVEIVIRRLLDALCREGYPGGGFVGHMLSNCRAFFLLMGVVICVAIDG